MEFLKKLTISLERFTATCGPTKPSGLRLLVATSGGPDSIALLEGLRCLAPRWELSVSAAHVNHQLRATSQRDEELVRAYCAQHQLSLSCKNLSSTPAGANLEAWARSERYRLLSEIRSEMSADWILTAHHADDLIETLLIRLLANKEPRSILEVDTRRNLFRPILRVSRSEILEYLAANSVPFCRDESNDDVRFTRNRVRNRLLPLVEAEFGSSSRECLLERALALAQDEAALSELADQALSRCTSQPFGSKAWAEALRLEARELPSGTHWRLAERALAGLLHYRLGRKKSAEVLEVIWGLRVATELPGGYRFSRSGGVSRLERLP